MTVVIAGRGSMIQFDIKPKSEVYRDGGFEVLSIPVPGKKQKKKDGA